MRHLSLYFTAFLILIIGSATETTAQNGEAVFNQYCSACHKVGGGRLVGPDLMGITSKRPVDWLVKWTQSSQALVKSGDPEAKKIFDEFSGMIMPDQNIPEADIKSIFAYIDTKSSSSNTASASETPKAPASNASDKATPEDIAIGRSIFIGSQRLANGGPACISCHNVNYKDVLQGGLLAKDLTDVFSRMGGDAGLQGILGAPPFPAMTQAYKDKHITDKESAYLIAFLNKVNKDTANQSVASYNILLVGGVGGACGLLLLILAIWHGRKRFAVKKSIFNRQLKSSF